MVGFGDFESLYARLRNEKAIAEKFLVRRFLAIRQAMELKELGNVYRIPGPGNPADELTQLKSDLAPIMRALESGSYNPCTLRRLCGVALCGD